MARRPSMFNRVAHRQSDHPTDPRQWGADCDHCPLKGSTPVWGDGPKDAEMAVIAESPSRDETATGLPLCGRAGELLEAYLGKFSVKRSEIWVDQAVMCFPPGGDLKAFLQRSNKETKAAGGEVHSPVTCCRPRLMRALKTPVCGGCSKFVGGANACSCEFPQPIKVKGAGNMPKVIIPLGNVAMEAVLGVTGITARRGYVFDLVKRREERTEKAVKGKK